MFTPNVELHKCSWIRYIFTPRINSNFEHLFTSNYRINTWQVRNIRFLTESISKYWVQLWDIKALQDIPWPSVNLGRLLYYITQDKILDARNSGVTLTGIGATQSEPINHITWPALSQSRSSRKDGRTILAPGRRKGKVGSLLLRIRRDLKGMVRDLAWTCEFTDTKWDTYNRLLLPESWS